MVPRMAPLSADSGAGPGPFFLTLRVPGESQQAVLSLPPLLFAIGLPGCFSFFLFFINLRCVCDALFLACQEEDIKKGAAWGLSPFPVGYGILS